MIIAIDGPAGTGKSSAAKGLAKVLGFHYVDTGAMYRAYTYHLLHDGTLDTFSYRTENGRHFVNDEEVTQAIRSPQVTEKVSEIAAIREVRHKIVSLQRSQTGDIVMEGRDIGTVVFPDADIKIFLTARPEIRARRRHSQLGHLTEEEILAAQQRRDTIDSTREISPLRPADDAWILDTSELSLDEVISQLANYVRNQR